MISNHISDNIPPQMKILNMIIPILMPFLQFALKLEGSEPHKAARHPTKCDVINDVKLFSYNCIYKIKIWAETQQNLSVVSSATDTS